jgi:hypothetical protein
MSQVESQPRRHRTGGRKDIRTSGPQSCEDINLKFVRGCGKKWPSRGDLRQLVGKTLGVSRDARPTFPTVFWALFGFWLVL